MKTFKEKINETFNKDVIAILKKNKIPGVFINNSLKVPKEMLKKVKKILSKSKIGVPKLIGEVVTTDALPDSTNIGPMKPSGKFRGMPFFNCPPGVFTKCVKGKRLGEHWKSFLGDDIFSVGLKGWIKENPRTPFLFRNETTKSFIFARKF